VAEGIKTINELLNSSIQLHHLYTTTLEFDVLDDVQTEITNNELQKISFLKTPNKALALFKTPESEAVDYDGLIIALDNVRDPGNLGTIIRLCDWFGVKDIICSIGTVDCYNPKVIQGTMGSIGRVNLSYVDLKELLSSRTETKFGTFMNAESVYDMNLPDSGILILGNEANGISKGVAEELTTSISIPQFGDLLKTESLNVANVAAILLSEFKRRTIEK
jgi:TrmH family RNA methyltransferase